MKIQFRQHKKDNYYIAVLSSYNNQNDYICLDLNDNTHFDCTKHFLTKETKPLHNINPLFILILHERGYKDFDFTKSLKSVK